MQLAVYPSVVLKWPMLLLYKCPLLQSWYNAPHNGSPLLVWLLVWRHKMLRPTLLLPHASHMCLLHSTPSISRPDSKLLLYTASACSPTSAVPLR